MERDVKKYRFTTTTGIEQDLTEEDLCILLMLDLSNINLGTTAEVIKRLDSGFDITDNYYEFDFNLGANVYKGRFTLTSIKQKPSTPPPIPKSAKCDHKGAYVNEAGGVRFIVCPKCKQDLGDA